MMHIKFILIIILHIHVVHSFTSLPAAIAIKQSVETSQSKDEVRNLDGHKARNRGENSLTERGMGLMVDCSDLDSAQLGISFCEQNLEAEVLGDLAHMILDFATIFSFEDSLIWRLFLLVGRMCGILSDYIPDQSMSFDEVLFQSLLFAISLVKVYEKCIPFWETSESVSFQDRKIYLAKFRPAGFTWLQYKHLVATSSLEWIELPKDTTLHEYQNNVLLTYQGSIANSNMALVNDDHTYGRRNGRSSHDFIGDLSLFKDLLDNKGQTITKPRDPVSFKTSTGATLLRINTDKLLACAQSHSDIADNTKNLIFNGIQERLNYHSQREYKKY